MRSYWSWKVCASLFIISLSIPQAGSAANSTRRAYTVEDTFRLESVGIYVDAPYEFGPKGQSMAFTLMRPDITLRNQRWETVQHKAAGDVWVQGGPGERAIDVTHGERNGSGWWAPQWSPDGQKLAMLSTALSTAKSGNVYLWLWDPHSRQLRQLSPRDVDIDTRQLFHQRPFLWLDARHLLVPVLPGGKQPHGEFSMRLGFQTPIITSREWRKAAEGMQPTASVLDSGIPVNLAKRPHDQLWLLDVTTGEKKILANAAVASWRVSPNGKVIAFTPQASVYLPKTGELLPFRLQGKFTLNLVTLNGMAIDLKGEISKDVLRHSLRWSSDGKELAFLGYTGDDRSRPPQLYRIDLTQRTVTHRLLVGLDAAPSVYNVYNQAHLKWTADNHLMVFAARLGYQRPAVTARRDWWLIEKSGRTRCLTVTMKSVPKQLWLSGDGHTFVGLAAGELWLIDPAAGTVRNLTAGLKSEIVQVVWPTYTSSGIEEWRKSGRTFSRVMVDARGGNGQVSPYRVNLDDGHIAAVSVPASGAELKEFVPASDSAIFYRSDNRGLFVWRSDLKTGHTTTLVEANTFLRGIAKGKFKSIEYTSLNGKPLKAWLILPPNYRSGQRYPLLTWVYAGLVYGSVPPWWERMSLGYSINMQIPAAHGYVVLMPSMPLRPMGTKDDPMLLLPNGVLPAVEKVIEMGIADPKRLFLMGQSFGGFSTFGLVTQTDRFTAAVSVAGLSDLISWYGQFDECRRYTDHPQEFLYPMAHMESSQGGMGYPPWNDLGHYLRNSPVLYADRINTPLMIIHGDLDCRVPIQQSEEMFNALYRQGKRARFVRYWGDGHVLTSPANARDMWQRIFAWFDEFSPKASSTKH